MYVSFLYPEVSTEIMRKNYQFRYINLISINLDSVIIENQGCN